MNATLKNFADQIRNLDPVVLRSGELPESLLLEREGRLDVYYAPFEYVAPLARLVVVGITPGRTQMVNALIRSRDLLRNGHQPDDVAREVKSHASFSGAMRASLVALLEEIGVPKRVGADSGASLFGSQSSLVHLTSALQFPVFVDGRDYRGTPSMLRTPMLRRQLEVHMERQLSVLSPDAWFLPLGPTATEGLQHLARQGLISGIRILSGVPHPSGANSERIAVFLGRKAPHMASVKTNATKLLTARARLKAALSQ